MDGIDTRHKNLLRRSFHIQMVLRSSMRVYPENTVKWKKFKGTSPLLRDAPSVERIIF
jgi:hypothetical protein